jgi:hypothetical protein
MLKVGGSKGQVSTMLARHFKNLQFIVQDMANAVAEGESELSPDLKTRITFMTHDFFQPQPIKAASVYLLRWILHDWPDKDCVKILKALVPALKHGSRLVICEAIMPPRGFLPHAEERFLTYVPCCVLFLWMKLIDFKGV